MRDQEIISIAKNHNEIIVVAAGDYGEYLYKELEANLPEKEIYISDNSRKAQGQREGFFVNSVSEMIDKHPKACFLITSSFGKDMIRTQLLEAGIDESNIHYAVTEEAIAFSEKRKEAVKLQPLEKISFEVDIVGHCNLNCRSCSNFSCLAEPEFIDVEQMERDFQKMGNLFHGECEHIYLIGGEPLLHPAITRCMKIARTAFPSGSISVFTNGLLLSKMDDSFWETCREYSISLIVTKYPIKMDYESMQTKADNEEVKFTFFGTSEDFSGMNNLGLDLEGNQDPKRSFVQCSESNKCIKLREGMLYTCPRPAAIHRFNRFFDKSIEVSKDDGIDIYGSDNGTEVLKKLAKPIPFCRYCKKDPDSRKTFPWGITERDINEWL